MRSESVDIVLIVDQKWRDLPGMAALAVWLQDGFGLSTELIPYPLWRYSLAAWRPQVIAVTHMNGPRSRAITDAAAAMGTRVVVIPTEGRPGNQQAMEYAVGRKVDCRGVDLWFAWSEVVRDYMLEREVLPPEKIVVAGVPRFDMYNPPWDDLLLPREEFARRFGLSSRKPIISWATNFTHARYHIANQRYLAKDWHALGLLKFSYYSAPDEFARKDYEARESHLEIIRELLRARPEVQLALKPHPQEEPDRYADFVRQCRADFGPRVALVTSGYIWDLLNAADVHVHHLCTTGVEAWLRGVPSISLHREDYFSMSVQIEGAMAEAAAADELVRDAEGLIAKVDHYLSDGKPTVEQQTRREQYVQRWFHKVDGRRCRAYAAALARLIGERRSIRRPKIDLSLVLAVARTAINGALGRPLYSSLWRWRRNGPWAGRLGQVDNYHSPSDAAEWRRRVGAVVASQIESPVAD